MGAGPQDYAGAAAPAERVAGSERVPLVAVYVVLFLLGAVLGVWGAFLVPLRLPGGVEGLADVIAVGGNVAVGWLAARGAGTVPAAAMSGVGWLIAVLVVTGIARPSDEVVVPGSLGTDPGIGTVGTVFLFGGALAAVVPVLLANRRLRIS